MSTSIGAAAVAIALASLGIIGCSGDAGSSPGATDDTGLARDGAPTDGGTDAATNPPTDAGSDVAADTSATIDTGPPVPAGCQLIEVGDVSYVASRSSDINALVQGPLKTSLGDPAIPDGFSINVLGRDTTVVKKTGTFELGVGIEANYSTAEHDVLVFEDPTSSGSVRRFFPVSGQLTIDPTTPPSTAATKGMKGRLSSVKMIEVTIDATTHVSTPVAGGKCVYIADKVLDIKAP